MATDKNKLFILVIIFSLLISFPILASAQEEGELPAIPPPQLPDFPELPEGAPSAPSGDFELTGILASAFSFLGTGPGEGFDFIMAFILVFTALWLALSTIKELNDDVNKKAATALFSVAVAMGTASYVFVNKIAFLETILPFSILLVGALLLLGFVKIVSNLSSGDKDMKLNLATIGLISLILGFAIVTLLSQFGLEAFGVYGVWLILAGLFLMAGAAIKRLYNWSGGINTPGRERGHNTRYSRRLRDLLKYESEKNRDLEKTIQHMQDQMDQLEKKGVTAEQTEEYQKSEKERIDKVAREKLALLEKQFQILKQKFSEAKELGNIQEAKGLQKAIQLIQAEAKATHSLIIANNQNNTENRIHWAQEITEIQGDKERTIIGQVLPAERTTVQGPQPVSGGRPKTRFSAKIGIKIHEVLKEFIASYKLTAKEEEDLQNLFRNIRDELDTIKYKATDKKIVDGRQNKKVKKIAKKAVKLTKRILTKEKRKENYSKNLIRTLVMIRNTLRQAGLKESRTYTHKGLVYTNKALEVSRALYQTQQTTLKTINDLRLLENKTKIHKEDVNSIRKTVQILKDHLDNEKELLRQLIKLLKYEEDYLIYSESGPKPKQKFQVFGKQ